MGIAGDLVGELQAHAHHVELLTDLTEHRGRTRGDEAKLVHVDDEIIEAQSDVVVHVPVDAEGHDFLLAAAHAAGKLSPGVSATYFSQPRPVYELYDLEADPSELNNLSGSPALREVEHSLRVALTEKMILDWDYLPLPDVGDAPAGTKAANRKAKKKE